MEIVTKERRSNGQSILALNCGSSSLKFGLYAVVDGEVRPLRTGEAEEIGSDQSTFYLSDPKHGGKTGEKQKVPLADHGAALRYVLKKLGASGAAEPDAVGHRIVHGGLRIRTHQLLTDETVRELESAQNFAPLHLPLALMTLEAMREHALKTPQVACLDTAFHVNLPEVARTLPLSEKVRNLGVERFGFHGLSLESILAQMDSVPEKVVVAHLGNGSSVTAILDGVSVDTVMGLTPTGGVMMGTRCGDLDPGIVIFLMRHGYSKLEEFEDLFDHKSGLKGVSGFTSDVRDLVAVRRQNAKADLALRMFCQSIRKAIAAMVSSLDGLDELVFTGGIGQHATEIREEILSGLRHLGDFETRVLPAQEELQIARITNKLAGV
jgi:acetate kinase